MALMSDTDILAAIKAVGAGATGVYTPYGGAPSTVYCVFTSEYVQVEKYGVVSNELEVTAECRASDITGTAQGGTFVINSTTYQIMRSETDGEGWVMLVLSEVAA